jgi:hypothetical protein
MKEEYTSYKFSEDFHLITSGKKLGYEFAEAVLLFLCFYPALAIINLIITKNSQQTYKGILLLVPVIIIVYSSSRIKRLILLIAANLAAAALGAILLGKGKLWIIYFIFLSLFSIHYIRKKVKRTSTFWRFWNLTGINIFTAGVYCFTLYDAFISLKKLVLAFSVLQIIIATSYFHFSSTSKLMKWEKYSDDKHAGTMRTSNVMVSILMTIVFGMIVLIAAVTQIFSRLDLVSLNIISSLLKAGNKDIRLPKSELFKTEQQQLLKPLDLEGGAYTPAAFFTALEFIVKFIAIAGAGIVLIIAVVALARKIYRVFTMKLGADETIESTASIKEITESLINSIKKPVLRLRNAAVRNNKDKLRRLYLKAVLHYKRNGTLVEKWNTPLEIETNILKHNNIELESVTALYERFRYSEEEPSDLEVEEMKKLVNGVVKRGR